MQLVTRGHNSELSDFYCRIFLRVHFTEEKEEGAANQGVAAHSSSLDVRNTMDGIY